MIACPSLWFGGFSCVGLVDIVHEDAHGGSVVYDVMEVGEEIQVLVCPDDSDAEQLVLPEVEGLYELGLQCLQFCFAHLFDGLLIGRVVWRHDGVPLCILPDMCLDE